MGLQSPSRVRVGTFWTQKSFVPLRRAASADTDVSPTGLVLAGSLRFGTRCPSSGRPVKPTRKGTGAKEIPYAFEHTTKTGS